MIFSFNIINSMKILNNKPKVLRKLKLQQVLPTTN